MDNFIWYGSYVVFLLLGYSIYKLIIGYKNKRNLKSIGKYIVFLLISLLFIHTRFIEPNLIKVNRININSGFDLKVGVISDIHLGKFKKAKFLDRVVTKLNQQDLDIILILGDFVYNADKTNLNELFLPFKRLNKPVYGVLGNHDGLANPEYQKQLKTILEKYNVDLIDNQIVNFDNFQLIGVGSYLGNENNLNMLASIDKVDNTIVAMHNPDSLIKSQTGLIDYALAGHTHGGQIRVPWLYKRFIPTTGDFDKGYHKINGIDLYITSGIGEINLPMRFLNLPEIMILEFEV